ncbi:hypothetical protein [Saccharothrix sp. ALI-22-I]|uniref:hypothetical protein n=1 Tax=Saccharothrix sp. ALI-22-I TaxID=1933778 RepID=UPI001EE716DA|nr:hypothetical protein [Saccharothrix sp. ALI-22-I]
MFDPVRLAVHGAHVVVNDISAEAAGETLAELVAAGGSAEVAVGDVLGELAVDPALALDESLRHERQSAGRAG